MKKILIVITTDFVSYGGLASVMMNYYNAMNKKDIQVDFASTNIAPKNLASELQVNNSSYFCLGNRKRNLLKYLFNLVKLLKKEQYDVIHVNGNSSTMAIELQTARFCGIKQRLAHGHTTRTDYPLIHKILTIIFRNSYTVGIAVSNKTGKWLFKKGYRILNNAIDIKHYKFDGQLREQFRIKYNLENKFVVGNVGKLNPSKNHSYLLKVFSEIRKIRRNAFLVIAGGGELEGQLKKETYDLGISDFVLFLGMVEDAAPVLQAMDVFVFTSIFEGLGMALIEAQASGLRCVCSDIVPKETRVTGLIQYVSLRESPVKWAEIISLVDFDNRTNASEKAYKSITAAGYNIDIEAYKLRKIYLDKK